MRSLDRREFLRAGTAAIGLGLALPLAACGEDEEGAAARADRLRFQLAWIPNAEFAGTFLGEDRGYFRDEGVELRIQPGGPDVVTPPLVATGKADVALASTDVAARAAASGAPLRIFAAHYQRTPLAVTSLAERPLRTPGDLRGRRIGVQASNDSTWTAFLEVNQIEPGEVDTVAVQFDPSPLTEGSVDGFLTFLIDQPLALAREGVEVVNLALGDFGFELFGYVYVARSDDLEQRGELIARFLRAEQRGWTDNLEDPEAGAAITVERAPKSLALRYRTELDLNRAQAPLFDRERASTPLLGMDEQSIAANRRTLASLGIEDTNELFTLDVVRHLRG